MMLNLSRNKQHISFFVLQCFSLQFMWAYVGQDFKRQSGSGADSCTGHVEDIETERGKIPSRLRVGPLMSF